MAAIRGAVVSTVLPSSFEDTVAAMQSMMSSAAATFSFLSMVGPSLQILELALYWASLASERY